MAVAHSVWLQLEEKRAQAAVAEEREVQRQTAVVEEGLAQAKARALASASASSSASTAAPEAKAPTATEAAKAAPPAAGSLAAAQQEVDEGTQQRLASFVQGVAGGGKQALEALKAQQQSGAGSGNKGA